MAVTNVSAFAESWWAWWHRLNPNWRKDAASKTVDCRWVERVSGSWLALRMPGRNGFLSVLACLKWWRESVEKEGDLKDWDMAVRDVGWAIRSLQSELSPSKYVLLFSLFALLTPYFYQ